MVMGLKPTLLDLKSDAHTLSYIAFKLKLSYRSSQVLSLSLVRALTLRHNQQRVDKTDSSSGPESKVTLILQQNGATSSLHLVINITIRIPIGNILAHGPKKDPDCIILLSPSSPHYHQ